MFFCIPSLFPTGTLQPARDASMVKARLQAEKKTEKKKTENDS